jgi:fructosamine-3-kinase
VNPYARIRTEVSAALDVCVTAATPVAGGCISPSYRLACADDTIIFVKAAPSSAPTGLLEQEAASLRQIAQTGTVRVPSVLAVTAAWLALEWLEPARATNAGWEELGRSLARLHRNRAPQFGREAANCIGALRQSNDWSSDWPSFWRTQRLQPQVSLAAARLGGAAVTRFEQLYDGLDERLAAAGKDGPSLLHGDLWSGNVHFTDEGSALIDPSSYYGHREVDLAMAALFGGFPGSFFAAYSSEWPLIAGAESRRPVYQLYYLLVHVNLFGGGYVRQTLRMLDTAVAG